MDIFNTIALKISRLTVLFYQLIWTIRHKGFSAAAGYLLQRLGVYRQKSRPDCAQRSLSADELNAKLARLDLRPTFCLVVPAGDDPRALQSTLDSIQVQLYSPSQIILLTGSENDAASWLVDLCDRFQLTKLRIENASLLDTLTGEYFCVVFPGDILSADALGQVAILAGLRNQHALIYGDEDFSLPGGKRGQLVLKPDWSPEFLLSTDYLARAAFFNRKWAARAGWTDQSCSRASLYDLALKITEIGPTPMHLPKLLLTRAEKGPELDDAADHMAVVLQTAVQRRGLDGNVSPVENQSGYFITHFRPPDTCQTSILIATRDQPELLHKCLESIFTITQHSRFDVILVNHESQRPETKETIAQWRVREPERFQCLSYSGDFNFSRINNYAASHAKGNLLLLLNNDTEVIAPNWLEEMAGYACLPTSGAVGAALEYPNGHIQHGGILMGVTDLAVHAFKDLPARAPGYMGRLQVPSNFLAVTGACLMVRADVFQALGGLSEDFAVAGGDIDFCLRIAREGMYNILLPHVRLIHHELATRGFEDSYQKYSRLKTELDLLGRRWPEYISRDPYYHPCFDTQGRFSTRA